MAEEKTSVLLAQRKARKRGLNFVEKESKFKASIKARWRRPRGKHNPVRECHKGRPGMPHPGYGSPKAVRGLVLDGKVPVVVRSESDFEGLDVANVAVIFGRTVGMRKKMKLAKIAAEKKFTLLNMKDASAYVEASSQKLAARTKKRAKVSSSKAKAQEAVKAAASTKKADAKTEEKNKEAKESAKAKKASAKAKASEKAGESQ